jgi:hypothetical protein
MPYSDGITMPTNKTAAVIAAITVDFNNCLLEGKVTSAGIFALYIMISL